ncbi:MAG: Chitooligosaccharide deacetylase [Rhodospirillales bacterium]|nr:Chitooligosaccharide deacetylase [Rhodospirillales bacterium]
MTPLEHGGRIARRVTLTFDNGPHPDVTPAVLAILARRGIKATFFVLGKAIGSPEGRALIERTLGGGHRVGNHGFSHETPFGLLADPEEGVREIVETQRLLDKIGIGTRMFRPFGGGGYINAELLSAPAANYLVRERFDLVLWNSVPRDWERPADWAQHALNEIALRDWTVTVLHDIPDASLEQLPAFLDQALQAGVEFTTELPIDFLPMAGGVATADISAMVPPAQRAVLAVSELSSAAPA